MSIAITITDQKAAGRSLVELVWPELEPRLKALLAAHTPTVTTPTKAPLSSSWDDATCAGFAHELGDPVLDKAAIFFAKLAADGQVSSLELMQLLGRKRAPDLAFVLTTPVKRIAKRLGLPLPFDIGETPDGTRTVWHDRDGIAARMVSAVAHEQQRRSQP